MRLTPAQGAVYHICGRKLPIGNPDTIPECIRSGRKTLFRITGKDFGYDLAKWHDYLKETGEGGYPYRKNTGLPKIMKTALKSPSWCKIVATLSTETTEQLIDSIHRQNSSDARWFLKLATKTIPKPSTQIKNDYIRLIREHSEFLDQNEFEPALDRLEEIAGLIPCRGGFWRNLERAAQTLGLSNRATRYREEFKRALDRLKMQNQSDDPGNS